MKRLNKRRKSEDEETSYWLSYSDMMAGLLLVFVLIISFTMLQAKSQYEAKEEELAEQAVLIFAQQDELNEKQLQLEEQQSQLLDQQSLLSDQQTLLSDQQSQLDEQKSALETLQEMLANQEKLLADKEALVGEQQEKLDDQQRQLDKIIGVKAELIEALKNEFENTNLSVTVDSKTGAITLESSILFDTEESDLKETGEILLDSFIPAYMNVLLSEQFRDYVSEIIIEGHTDTNGSYMHNLELSQWRALSVATYFLTEENGVLSTDEIDALRDIITVNGKSYSNPVYYDDGTVNMEASRRVEFKFRLNDEDMVQEMLEILEGED